MVALAAVGTSGCSLRMMNKMRKPAAVESVDARQFPEGEQAFARSSVQWRPTGTARRAFMMHDSWQMRPDDSLRYVGVRMYFAEPNESDKLAGKLYKGAEGEDAICYEYDCVVAEVNKGGSFGAPVLECNQDTLRKVTCTSVDTLPEGMPLT
jgi:hypothetical protein